jgi:hypothetical protein
MQDRMISIVGLEKADVLAALWNNALQPPEWFSRELYSGSTRMSREQAAAHLEQHDGWDYLDGRLLKMNIGGDSFDPWGYDRDNGAGLAARVIAHLRETGSIEAIDGEPGRAS